MKFLSTWFIPPCPILSTLFCGKGGKPRMQTASCYPGRVRRSGRVERSALKIAPRHHHSAVILPPLPPQRCHPEERSDEGSAVVFSSFRVEHRSILDCSFGPSDTCYGRPAAAIGHLHRLALFRNSCVRPRRQSRRIRRRPGGTIQGIGSGSPPASHPRRCRD